MLGLKKIKVSQTLINILLLILLFVLFFKISFFKDLFLENTQLYDFNLYRVLLEKIRLGVNPYSEGLIYSWGPPLVFLYYFPFSFLESALANYLVSFLNIFLGFILCFNLAKSVKSKKIFTYFLILSLIFFSSFPVRFSLGMGQPSIFVAFLISFVLTSKNKLVKSIAISFLITLKTFYIYTLLTFIRNKKIIITALLMISLWTLISFTFIKPDWYIYYFKNIFPNANNPPLIASGLDYYNQSLKSTFYRFGVISIYPILFPLILFGLSVVILISGSFELATISSLLLSPISWQHYFVSLFPIFVIFFFKMKRNVTNLIFFFSALFLWWVEFPGLHSSKINFINSMLASHYFLSGLILYFLVLRNIKKNKPNVIK